MLIQLPEELEGPIRAEVRRGHFASVDQAVAEAVRLFLQEREPGSSVVERAEVEPGPDPVIGAMREDGEELVEIVEDAMRRRLEETWRPIPGE